MYFRHVLMSYYKHNDWSKQNLTEICYFYKQAQNNLYKDRIYQLSTFGTPKDTCGNDIKAIDIY